MGFPKRDGWRYLLPSESSYWPSSRRSSSSAASSPPWQLNWRACGRGSAAVPATPQSPHPATGLGLSRRHGLRTVAASAAAGRHPAQGQSCCPVGQRRHLQGTPAHRHPQTARKGCLAVPGAGLDCSSPRWGDVIPAARSLNLATQNTVA